jgi:ATP-binding cassette subfamily B protein
VDGQDISTLTLESLREHISVVSQEPFLFNGTMRENILYGKLDATEAELIAAAQGRELLRVHRAPARRLRYRVGERGVKLSVGEKQAGQHRPRVVEERALLILDEATASVDTATERLIQEALEHLMPGRTSFVIAHRLSTIRNADQILVLRAGRNHRARHARGTADAARRTLRKIKLARIQNTLDDRGRFREVWK